MALTRCVIRVRGSTTFWVVMSAMPIPQAFPLWRRSDSKTTNSLDLQGVGFLEKGEERSAGDVLDPCRSADLLAEFVPQSGRDYPE